MKRVLLLSTVHRCTDPRITGKIAPALKDYYDVSLLLTRAHSNTSPSCLSTVPYFRYLHYRLLFVHPLVWLRVLSVRPDIVHIFVPELLPLAFILHVLGVRVIYEVQENLYFKLHLKEYNNNFLYRWLFSWMDQKAQTTFECVFTDEGYLNTYTKLYYPATLVRNFANPHPLFTVRRLEDIQPHFLYAGVLSRERALPELIQAFNLISQEFPNAMLHLCGAIPDDVQLQQWGIDREKNPNIIWYGYLPISEVFKIGLTCSAGIALLHPVGDYTQSYPSKLFDYMSIGLPVICSDFNIYRTIVETNKIGFCVSPSDIRNLTARLKWLLDNKQEAYIMGQHAYSTCVNAYNWETERVELLRMYNRAVAK